MARLYLSLVCLALTAATCRSAKDPTFPDIKKLMEGGFISQVEISGQPENYTASVEEYYDVANKITKINILNRGHRKTIILHPKYNQAIKIENNTCEVKKAADMDDFSDPYFQKWLYSGEGDTSEVYYGPTSILREAYDNPPDYSGPSTVRGMNCHKFTTTDPHNKDVSINYYFTADWTTPIDVPKTDLLPVRIELFGYGKPTKDVSLEDYVQYIEYVSFIPQVKDPRVFELPFGIGCKDLKSDEKDMPSIPERFTLVGETFFVERDSDKKSVNTYRVWYDLPAKLARIDIYTKNDRGTSKVLDYNTGVMYVTRDNEECEALPISDSYFDQITGDLQLVMKDPASAMGMNGNFYYLGKAVTRGIYCDVWESVVENYTVDDLTLNRMVYTYYFSAHWWEFDVEGVTEQQIPIRLEMNSYLEATGDPITKSVFNFFQFNTYPQIIYTPYNIEDCADAASDKSYIAIIMSTDMDDATKAEKHATEVKEEVTRKIRSVAGISPIRLLYVRVDFEPEALTVMALILGRAPAIDQFIKLENDKPKSKEKKEENVKSAEECAEKCAGKDFCTGFHFCSGNGECFTSDSGWTTKWGDDLPNFKPCELYQRHVAGSSQKDVPLQDALDNLEKEVNAGKFTISIVDKDKDNQNVIVFKADDFESGLSPVSSGDHDSDMFFRIVGQKKFIKDQQTVRSTRAITSGDCYRKCKKEENIACSSFSFCSDTNECLMSSLLMLYVDDNNDALETSPLCNVFSIDYLQMFEEYPGQVHILPGKDAINVNSPDECAKKCRERKEPMCRGFDYCNSKSQCILHEKHVLDVKGTSLDKVGSGCSHFALRYSADFVEMGRLILKDPKSKEVKAVSEEECAKQCSENIEFQCSSFGFCVSDDSDKRTCTLNSLTLEDDGVKTEDSDVCQYYAKKNVVEDFAIKGKDGKGKTKTPDPSDTSGYTAGGLAWVIVGVLILGIVVGIIGFFIYSYFRKTRSMDDRTVKFVKQENA